MIEVQCPSCQTRYRLDEGALPQENPTFKCSRCGHVFSSEPRAASGPTPPLPQPAQAKSPSIAAAASEPPRDDNPLARSFAETDLKVPENLSFDFSDDSADDHHLGESDEPTLADDPREHWQVGETADPPAAPSSALRPRARARGRAHKPAAALAGDEEDGAQTRQQAGPLHSSGFFLLLFALAVMAYAVLTLLLGVAPAASRAWLAQLPVIGTEFQDHPTLESQVKLDEVHVAYRQLDNHRLALVVNGSAHNHSSDALHTIEVAVNLVDGQRHSVAGQQVFCGNLLSARFATEMTPHELQFFQKLAPRNFILPSGASAPFMAVFVDPPAQARGVVLAVVRAEPPAVAGEPGL
ncbi:MAG TPA: DUF3426 domain-containing protein [Candidatus Binataceae bacterium]|nr:DUF3426 domain-containing protein [Candidatus Binataceae bacterium]